MRSDRSCTPKACIDSNDLVWGLTNRERRLRLRLAESAIVRRRERPQTDWPDALFAALLEADVRTVAYVPDAGHARVISLAHGRAEHRHRPLTTEEEGIGYLAGAWLGGLRGVLLMQSSGVGNCINTLALAAQARFPLLMLVTMRGEWAELNPWQNPAGAAVEEALRLMGVRTWRADRAEDVEPLVRGALAMTFAGDMSCAVLLGQRLIGPNGGDARRWRAARAPRGRARAARRARRARRRDGPRLAVLRRHGRRRPRPQLLPLGRDGQRRDGRPRTRARPATAARAGDHGRRRAADGPRRARDDRRAAPANLTIAVLDNERYAETGMPAEPHGVRRAARRDRGRVRLRVDGRGDRARPASRTCAGARPPSRARASPSSRSHRPTCRACCRRSTPCTSSTACAGRSASNRASFDSDRVLVGAERARREHRCDQQEPGEQAEAREHERPVGALRARGARDEHGPAEVIHRENALCPRFVDA